MLEQDVWRAFNVRPTRFVAFSNVRPRRFVASFPMLGQEDLWRVFQC